MNNILLSKCLVIIHIFIHFLPIIIKIIYINDTKYDIYILLSMLLIKIHWFFLKGLPQSFIGQVRVIFGHSLGRWISTRF